MKNVLWCFFSKAHLITSGFLWFWTIWANVILDDHFKVIWLNITCLFWSALNRVGCTSSSSSTTMQLRECVCSSCPYLRLFALPGFMVYYGWRQDKKDKEYSLWHFFWIFLILDISMNLKSHNYITVTSASALCLGIVLCAEYLFSRFGWNVLLVDLFFLFSFFSFLILFSQVQIASMIIWRIWLATAQAL